MKFKLDENFGTRTQRIFREAGYHVYTVRDQKLQGCPDEQIFEVCCSEQVCLVSLDLDFCDVTRFPPQESHGIAVLRLPQHSTLNLMELLVKQFLQGLRKEKIENKLWVIEPGRIRIHQSEESEG